MDIGLQVSYTLELNDFYIYTPMESNGNEVIKP